MRKNKLFQSILCSLVLCLFLSVTAFAQEDDLTLVAVEETVPEEDLVMASFAHSTILPDPTMYGAVFSNNSKVPLVFNMRSFAVETEYYWIRIYKGEKVDAKAYVAGSSGNFNEKMGGYNYTYQWDTTDITKYSPGTYTIACTAYYNSGKQEDEISNIETFQVVLEDYRLVLCRQFVGRIYEKILGRTADEAGLNAWSEKLYSGNETGSGIVEKFLGSQEFLNRNTTDTQYIQVLYEAILNRPADDPGVASWQSFLDQGFSRTYILKGFVDSQEFGTLCSNYGILKGTVILTENRDQNAGVTGFVGRLYNITLGRKPDSAGLNDWTGRLLTKAETPKQVAWGFVFSAEAINKNLSNTDYVKMLYRTMMNREADDPGLNTWVGELSKGTSREIVFNGFADSVEFKAIVASYGL